MRSNSIFATKYLTHPTKSPKLHLSLSLHRSFTRNWKHCFLTNPILNPTLLPAYLAVSTPNTIHLSRLPVCLPDSLDFDPLPIDFVLIERLWISWFPRLRFCGRCRSFEFTITITITTCISYTHVDPIRLWRITLKIIIKHFICEQITHWYCYRVKHKFTSSFYLKRFSPSIKSNIHIAYSLIISLNVHYWEYAYQKHLAHIIGL